MIITKLKGGLGNQMFQYAFARSLAEKNKDILKLDVDGLNQTTKDTKRKYILDKFNTITSIAKAEEIKKIKYPYGICSKLYRLINAKIFKQYYTKFYPKLLNLKGNIYLDGYFQSEKYFIENSNLLHKEFTLKHTLSKISADAKEKIISTPNTVSIHIRRGDYITNKEAKAHHGGCDLDYYKKAIEIIGGKIKNPSFFIFSDDIDWVKENLSTNNTTYVSNPNIPDYEELALMSTCNHHIIANSTFGWWGAWLNENKDKIVIAPRQWTIKKTADELSVLPPSWIQI